MLQEKILWIRIFDRWTEQKQRVWWGSQPVEVVTWKPGTTGTYGISCVSLAVEQLNSTLFIDYRFFNEGIHRIFYKALLTIWGQPRGETISEDKMHYWKYTMLMSWGIFEGILNGTEKRGLTKRYFAKDVEQIRPPHWSRESSRGR